MPYKDKEKQKAAQKQWVRQKRTGSTDDVVSEGSTEGSTFHQGSTVPSLESLKGHLDDPAYYRKLRKIRDGLKERRQLDQVMLGVDGLTFVEVDKLITIMG